MSYITIRDYGEDRFIEKKSEFIGYAKRVESEEEAKLISDDAWMDMLKVRNELAHDYD